VCETKIVVVAIVDGSFLHNDDDEWMGVRHVFFLCSMLQRKERKRTPEHGKHAHNSAAAAAQRDQSEKSVENGRAV
jgi:hypothetical protein